MNRRSLLKVGVGGGIAAAAGSIRYLSPRHDEVHRIRPSEPFPLLVRNRRDEPTTASVTIERDGADVLAETLDLEPGDSVKVIEIEQAGTYDVLVESEGTREERDVEVTWEHLADCNSNYFHVTVEEDEIDVSYFRTEIGCGGILWRSS